MTSSRRDFLRQVSSSALVASGASSLLSWAQAPATSPRIDVPGEDGLIVRSFRFVDLETPVEYFNTWLTPVPRFFVRNHMHEPVNSMRRHGALPLAGKSRGHSPYRSQTLQNSNRIRSSIRWNAPGMDADCTVRKSQAFNGRKVR